MRSIALALVVSLSLSSPLSATWSLVLCDTSTREVSVASVTCLTNFDLRALTPVVRVGLGAGVVQSAGDFDGTRRPIIRAGLIAREDPVLILQQLSGVAGHQDRQYGIVDTLGRTVSFSGSTNFAWAGGLTGQVGSIAYALQGNILTGPCVVQAMENVLLLQAGNLDFPALSMAMMQAARIAGGDGRCSCTPAAPTSCGCPPASVNKSGHIGFILVSRIGDTNDSTCNAGGCADGDYFMALNVANQPQTAQDPVLQMQSQFNAWANSVDGRPDAIRTEVSFQPGASFTDLLITVRDRDGDLVPSPLAVTVEHTPGSDQLTAIGPVLNLGAGSYGVSLNHGGGVGTDVFRIEIDDGIRRVVLMPIPRMCVGDVLGGLSSDCNGNGVADECETLDGHVADDNNNQVPDPCESLHRGDCNGDQVHTIVDVTHLLAFLFSDLGLTVHCEDACDANDDGTIDVVDAVTLLQGALFGSPAQLPPPFPGCGIDTTFDTLGCQPTGLCP